MVPPEDARGQKTNIADVWAESTRLVRNLLFVNLCDISEVEFVVDFLTVQRIRQNPIIKANRVSIKVNNN